MDPPFTTTEDTVRGSLSDYLGTEYDQRHRRQENQSAYSTGRISAMEQKQKIFGVLLIALLASPGRTPVYAARLIATPASETLPKGQWSVWQFGLYEQRSAKGWRRLNSFDLGLPHRFELGIFVVSPRNQPTDTWINVQHQLIPETGCWP